MSDPNAGVKKRQTIILVGSILVILMLVIGGLFFFDSGPKVRQEKPKTVSITAPGTVDDKDAWRASESAKSQDNANQINTLRGEVENQKETNKKLMERLEEFGRREANKSGKGEGQSLEEPFKLAGQPVLNSPYQKGAQPAIPLNAAPAVAELKKREIEIISFDKLGEGVGSSGAVGLGGKTETLGPPASETAKRFGNSGRDSVPGAGARNSIEFIPAGSFVRVAMLNGVDAPTGGQAQSNPLPVALHVLDVANLANKYKLDIKDCRFVAAAWGDLSSERAMGRIDTLTCIIDGETVEMPVKGSLIGEDGKAGIRGRLVTKQGQVLANALLAGIASGIGTAFKQSATINSTSAFGTTSVIDSNKVGQAALGNGIGNAGHVLEQYYLKAADKLFPVIETDGGRTIEVLVTKGAIYTGKAQKIGSNYRALLKRNGSNTRGDDDE